MGAPHSPRCYSRICPRSRCSRWSPLLGAQDALEVGGDIWLSLAKVVAVLVGVVLVGRYVLRPIFRVIAATRIREVFTAMALLTVIGTALIVERVGLSMALGAFLAGVLLAESEYRHELEAAIDPFKGLLLGLFFMAIGMTVNLGLAIDQPGNLAALVTALILLKFALLYVIGRLTGHGDVAARTLAITLSQGGEFAFVLFGFAAGAAVLATDVADLLILVVTHVDGIDAASPVCERSTLPFSQAGGRRTRVRSHRRRGKSGDHRRVWAIWPDCRPYPACPQNRFHGARDQPRASRFRQEIW